MAPPADPGARPDLRGRSATLLAATATVVVLVTVLRTVAAQDDRYPGTAVERQLPPWLLVVVGLATAVVLAASWAAARDRPRAAAGLSIAVVVTALPVWAGWPELPGWLRSITSGAAPLAIPALAAAAVEGRPQLSGRNRHYCAPAAPSSWAVTAVALHVLAYDPFRDPRCVRTCEDVTLAMEGVLDTGTVLSAWGALTAVAAAVALRGLLPPGPEGIAQASAASVLLLLAPVVVRAGGWGNADVQSLAVLLAPAGLLPLAAVVLAGSLRRARTRNAVDRVLAQLSTPSGAPVPGVLELHVAVPDEQRWVDAEGADVPEPALDRRAVVVRGAHGPALRLLLPEDADVDAVLAGLTPARRLRLENVRLTALARLRLRELQLSQRRVVARMDSERRRIERDLHDGAQQRLVSAALHLGAARALDPLGSGPLDAAAEEVAHALGQLRRLSHGGFPSVLAEEGLVPALHELLRESAVPATLEAPPYVRVGLDVAAAAYATVQSVLDTGEHRSLLGAAVKAQQTEELLTVQVRSRAVSEVTPALPQVVADRIGAVGGTVTTERSGGTWLLTVVLPCES